MKQILILEDEENLNRGINLKLTKEGYQVFSACTIQKAMDQEIAAIGDYQLSLTNSN